MKNALCTVGLLALVGPVYAQQVAGVAAFGSPTITLVNGYTDSLTVAGGREYTNTQQWNTSLSNTDCGAYDFRQTGDSHAKTSGTVEYTYKYRCRIASVPNEPDPSNPEGGSADGTDPPPASEYTLHILKTATAHNDSSPSLLGIEFDWDLGRASGGTEQSESEVSANVTGSKSLNPGDVDNEAAEEYVTCGVIAGASYWMTEGNNNNEYIDYTMSFQETVTAKMEPDGCTADGGEDYRYDAQPSFAALY